MKLSARSDSLYSLLSSKNDLIGGKDLLALGLEPGPDVGRILAKIREAREDGRVQDRAAALSLAKRLISTRMKINEQAGN